MPDGPITLLAGALLKKAVSSGVDSLMKENKRKAHYEERIENALTRHLGYVSAWSSRVQIFGMPQPADTCESTVALTLDGLPRQFRQVGTVSDALQEEDIVEFGANFALLGDPGAGKTTIMKRLAQRILAPPTSEEDVWSFPLVVVCRDHDWSKVGLAEHLYDVAGLSDIPKELLDSKKSKAHLLTDFLDEGPAMLLIDGLDEVPTESRRLLEKDLVSLATYSQLAKIVVSCRSGDYRHLEGFTLAEICPLDSEQIQDVVQHWTPKPELFFQALEGNPAADLLDRPLFLAQLLTVFKNSGGSIPEQPSSIYRQTVRLMLQDWDEQRTVARPSMYANFHVDGKMEFLSALSYHLMIDSQQIRFSHAKLKDLYSLLAPQFGLPEGEANKVAKEIEAHTGIIVESGDEFEFSHLSLQEYLCAYYIVREPVNDKVVRYIHEYPAPVAIAVALSSDPSQWLATIVLRAGVFEGTETIGSFVRRLGQERPRFTVSADLGFAFVKLMTGAFVRQVPPSFFEGVAKIKAVRESVALAMLDYTVAVTDNGEAIRIAHSGELRAGRKYTPPKFGKVDPRIYKRLMSPDG